MKIIDLLNKIANGEYIPKVINYENKVYHYVDEFKDYEFDDGGYCLFGDEFEKHYGITAYLNDEVEILDEPKEDKIEKLDDNFSYRLKMKDILWNDNEVIIVNKINELIDEINNLKEK